VTFSQFDTTAEMVRAAHAPTAYDVDATADLVIDRLLDKL
jgi:hypothetical protein